MGHKETTRTPANRVTNRLYFKEAIVDEFDCFDDHTLPSVPFKKIDLAVVGLHLTWRLAQAVSDALESLADMAGMHANHQVDQRAFADEARREIESIVESED